VNREDRVKHAAECLWKNEVLRFLEFYDQLENPLEWTLFYDLDEKWVSMEREGVKFYFGSENK